MIYIWRQKSRFAGYSQRTNAIQEIQAFENEISKCVEQLVIFRDEEGRVVKIQPVRLLEKGYENMLKIASPDDKKTSKSTPEIEENAHLILDKALHRITRHDSIADRPDRRQR